MVRIHPLEEPDSEFEEPPRETGARRAQGGALLALAALAVFHLWQLRTWTSADRRPPAAAEAVSLGAALDLREAVAAGDAAAVWRPKSPRPPLYAALVAAAGPDPERGAFLVNGVAMVLLCLSLWGVGRRFARGRGGDWPALAGALLFTCVPGVQSALCERSPGLAVAALVAAAYWIYLASESFLRTGPSLAFGLVCGAGLLAGWGFAPCLLPAWVDAAAALGDRSRRWRALAAGALGAALAGPWLLDQGLPAALGLVRVLAEDPAPLWRRTAFVAGLPLLVDGLGTPLWVLGLISLLVDTVQRGHGYRWTLLTWFALPYLLWAALPVRDLSGILPALPPLALLCALAWPKPLLALLCVFELVVALNYGRGVLPPLSGRMVAPLSFFPSAPPAAEPWPLGAALSELRAPREPGSPAGRLVLVAEHARLNPATLAWEARRAGLGAWRVRGFGPRLCELADALLVESRTLSSRPAGSAFESALRTVSESGGWFEAAYAEAGRWPIPGGNGLALYLPRRQREPPFRERTARFDYFEESGLRAEGLELELGAWDAARGVYPEVRVRARALALGALELRDVEAAFEGLSLVPIRPPRRRGDETLVGMTRDLVSDFRILGLKRVYLERARVDEDSLAALLKERLPRLRSPRVRLDREARVEGTLYGLPVKVELAAAAAGDGRGVAVELASLRVLGVPATFLLGRRRRALLELGPGGPFPFEAALSGLKIEDGTAVVSPDGV